MSIISHVHPATKVFWFSWGYDLYHYCWSEEQLYLPLTYQYRQKRRKSPTERLKALAHAVLDKVIANPDHWRSAVIARTDYCSTIVPTEYPIIRALPGFRAKEVFFNYGSMESLIAAMHKQQADGDNILVGNSNSPTSNHVDAFEKIAASGLTKHKVIVPLGYGVDNPYKAFVLDRGKYYFGNRFEPLLDFLPLAEYWKIVASCQTAVFNHTRQQALGNVLITTWLGANVYLNPQNPIYSHFKNIGISLYDFSLPFALHPATTPSDVMQARERLQSEYGAEVVRNRVVELLALRAS
ncbi:MAG: TDP-N-acetylfucosamine:lipid II N-acetylfucosaminyltransferase [Deltaproteobacteria bacterium]|nr:TDP-N-acetylfucosamine:lipid II N-acetylfucosaminyltransferase [Deltaproteobacteria bacterium]